MLTEAEKTKCRHHLGYLDVAAAYTFVLGLPTGVQTQFVIEGAFARVRAEAESTLRDILAELDDIECGFKLDKGLTNFTALAEMSIRPDAFKEQLKRYFYWRSALANLMGIYPNPYDQRFHGIDAVSGGLNVSVIH